MKNIIKLTGIKAIGHHGVNDGEQDRSQVFYIDIDLIVNVENDQIDKTQDYREVTEIVRKMVEQKKFNLIETMAYQLAKKIYALGKASGVKVIVHKPAAAKSLLIDDVTAEYIITGATI